MSEQPDEDALVALFAADLDDLVIVSDQAAFHADVEELFRRIALSPDDREAVRAVLETSAKTSRQYTVVLMRQVSRMLGEFIVFDVETWQMSSFRSRLSGVALAVRTLLPPSSQRVEQDRDFPAEPRRGQGEGIEAGDGPVSNPAEQGSPDDGPRAIDGR
ncbi:hypothetical protein [Agromyces albus]|uniref:hypothetical protein n=1 Tax=Agromyces albus TaxID=205332 RepID=UPI0027871239|nr:hypothetical protein [Agromyces albus]MDQ0576465.1 hypothetical protein [Agromyces albus]